MCILSKYLILPCDLNLVSSQTLNPLPNKCEPFQNKYTFHIMVQLLDACAVEYSSAVQ